VQSANFESKTGKTSGDCSLVDPNVLPGSQIKQAQSLKELNEGKHAINLVKLENAISAISQLKKLSLMIRMWFGSSVRQRIRETATGSSQMDESACT